MMGVVVVKMEAMSIMVVGGGGDRIISYYR